MFYKHKNALQGVVHIVYTLIECLKHLAFHLFLHSIFEAHVYKKHAVFQISFLCHQCSVILFIYLSSRNSSDDFRFRHTEKCLDLCVSWLINSFCRLRDFSLSHTNSLGHQTQRGCFLAPVRSVSQLFPAAQFHLAWNGLGGACPCPAPPAALWFSLTWCFLSKISSADQSGAQWLPGASQQSSI